MNHYYENNENLKSEIVTIDFYFRGKNLKFLSDNGVFSKKSIDFGSATLLQYLEKISDGAKVLDVGCGYGTIGVTLATLYPTSSFDLVDVNLRAVNLAKQNAISNNALNVNVFESNTYENINSKYDLIVTNPPIRAGKNVVHDIILNGFNYLNDSGSLWCVIQKKQGAPSAIKALEEKYRKVSVVAKDKGYYIIKAEK